jgi:hypothetical protein
VAIHTLPNGSLSLPSMMRFGSGNSLAMKAPGTWHEWKELLRTEQYEYVARHTLTKKYAWAIPCESALLALAELSPIIEIGCGADYWGWLLRKRGVDIKMFDSAVPRRSQTDNKWCGEETWTRVEQGNHLDIVDDHTLFLCWPPYDDSMAFDCLSRFGGKTLVYVGEHDGCTADARFRDKVEEELIETDCIEIPQWDGIHDAMWIYERK